MSVHDWNLIGGKGDFVGFENYLFVLQEPNFWKSLRNTFSIFFLSTVPQLIIAIVLAALLDANLRARTFWRMGVLLPYVVAPVAVSLIFGKLFADKSGLINTVLGYIGIDPIGWHAQVLPSHIAIATMVDFRWTGYNTLILLAAMQAIPKDLYEAAVLDGATRVRQFFSVTVPMLRPTIIFVVITSTIGGLQIFDEPRLFDQTGQGGPSRQWMTATMYIYELGWGNQKSFGRASAVAWILFLIIVVIGLINFSITRKISSETSTTEAEEGFPMSAPSLPVIRQTAGRGAARAAGRSRSTAAGSDRRPGWVTYVAARRSRSSWRSHPLYYAFLLASSNSAYIAQNPIPSLIPQGEFFDNVGKVLNGDIQFWKALGNSIIVGTITALSVVLFSTLAGFSFSKLRFRGRNALLVFVIATTAVPTQLGIVPLFILMSQLGLDRQAHRRHRPGPGHRVRCVLDDAVPRVGPAVRARRGRPRRRRVDDPDVLAHRPPGGAPGGRHARPVHVRRLVDELLLAVHRPRTAEPDAAGGHPAAPGVVLQGHVADHGGRHRLHDPAASSCSSSPAVSSSPASCRVPSRADPRTLVVARPGRSRSS